MCLYFTGSIKRTSASLQKISTVQAFRSGESIFEENTPGNKLYIVLSGRVKIFAMAGRKKKTLAYLEKGEFFGEMALLDMQSRSASSIAVEHTELLEVRQNDFRRLLVAHPDISLRIMKTLSRRLRQADKEIEALTFGDVLGRIASTLLRLALSTGR